MKNSTVPILLMMTIVSGCDVKESKNDVATYEMEKPSINNDIEEFNGKTITFKSTFNDKELNNTILQTNQEITYHTFDFKNKIVTLKSELNSKWTEINYPINGFYQDGVTYVIKVDELGVKEIWFSPTMLNLGYDFMDGTRISCYDVSVED